MRYVRFLLVIIPMMLTIIGGTTVFAQTGENDTKAFINRTTDQLREAGKPLTTEQIQEMEKLEGGRNFRNEVMNILTAEQKTALRNSYRNNTRRRRDPGNRGDFRAQMAETLKEAGHPITDEQAEQLKALEPGPGMREKMEEIFTEEQNKALQEARGRDRGQRRSPSEFIGKALEDAGDPLTDEQKKKMDALEFGQGMRDQINEILTDSQKKILEEQRQQRGGNRRN